MTCRTASDGLCSFDTTHLSLFLISDEFWESGRPSDQAILDALYGTSLSKPTEYVVDWSGRNFDCPNAGMNFEDLRPGTDVIPQYLNSYTIYILEAGDYMQVDKVPIYMDDCSAII